MRNEVLVVVAASSSDEFDNFVYFEFEYHKT